MRATPQRNMQGGCHSLVLIILFLSCALGIADTVVTGGPLPRDHEYEVHEVRFHWGKENQRGSEHTVNFKAFPMEVSVTLGHWEGCRSRSLGYFRHVNKLRKLFSQRAILHHISFWFF